jgi:hypothetical protein
MPRQRQLAAGEARRMVNLTTRSWSPGDLSLLNLYGTSMSQCTNTDNLEHFASVRAAMDRRSRWEGFADSTFAV